MSDARWIEDENGGRWVADEDVEDFIPEPGQGEDDDSTQPVETILEFTNSPSVTVTAA